MKKPNITAHGGPGNPTIYRDRFFRSRLEAHWAAFFDCVGWPWSYDPVDINGWTPDIVVGADRKIPCIVVPVDFMGPWRPILDFQEQLERAREAAGSIGFLLLGARPFGDTTTHVGLYFTNRPGYEAPLLSTDDSDIGLGQLDFVLSGPPYCGAITGRSYDHTRKNISPYVSWKDDVLPIWGRAGRELPALLRGV